MSLDSMKEIFEHMEQEGKPFWEIVLETDMDERQVTRNQSMAKMLITWQAMAAAADSYAESHEGGKTAPGYQFMRLGYFCLDNKDTKAGHPVFNRSVSLKDSFKK